MNIRTVALALAGFMPILISAMVAGCDSPEEKAARAKAAEESQQAFDKWAADRREARNATAAAQTNIRKEMATKRGRVFVVVTGSGHVCLVYENNNGTGNVSCEESNYYAY